MGPSDAMILDHYATYMWRPLNTSIEGCIYVRLVFCQMREGHGKRPDRCWSIRCASKYALTVCLSVDAPRVSVGCGGFFNTRQFEDSRLEKDYFEGKGGSVCRVAARRAGSLVHRM
jgi:hypothetical protein